MRIVIDTREQSPYGFDSERYKGVSVERGTLLTGDYSVAGLTDFVAVERKSLDDMAGTLTVGRERFERELSRARGLDFFAVIVEADMGQVARHEYRSKMKPKAFIQSLFAYQVRYGLHVVWAGSRAGAEYSTFSLLSKYVAEQRKRLRAITEAGEVAA